MLEQWAEHASGIAQGALWTALELEGFGANLQHMNAFPATEGMVAGKYGLPEDWRLKAQLVFGEVKGARPEMKGRLGFGEVVKVIQ